MADLSKTVRLVFEADDQASAKITQIADDIKAIDDTAAASGTGAKTLGDGLKTISDNAGPAATSLGGVVEGARNIGTEAGAAKGAVSELATALGVSEAAAASMIGPLTAAAAAAVVLVGSLAATEAVENFRTILRNTGDDAETAKNKLQFVVDAAKELGKPFGDAATEFVKFSTALKGSGLDADTAKAAYIGIAASITAVGGSSKDVQAALDTFAKAVEDGVINAKELDKIAQTIPGGLDALASKLGVTSDELKALADNGELSGAAIKEIADTLARGFSFESLQPVGDAFSNLLTSLVSIGSTIGDTGLYTLAVSAIAGGIDLIRKACELAAVPITGISALIGALVETAKAAGKAITGDISVDEFKDAVSKAFADAGDAARAANERFLGTRETLENVGTAAGTIKGKAEEGFGAAGDGADTAKGKTKELDDALKALGLNPAKFKQEASDVAAALDTLIRSDGVSGDQILAGLEAALKRLKSGDIEAVRAAGVSLFKAYEDGKISAEQLERAQGLLNEKLDGTEASANKAASGTRKVKDEAAEAAKELARAEAEANKFALELEKVASNERIKTIEASVKLNVAELQAQTEQVKAAFASIDVGIKSTGDLLGKLFDNLAQTGGSGLDRIDVRDQIEKENQRRDQEFALQKELVQAQIELYRQQASSLNAGDGLIKVDGSGLKPHLEAFMFEILRAIQVRVNRDGLKLLLGT